MKDDVERILEELTLRRAPAELRGRVLGAVAGELVATQHLPVRRSRWDIRLGVTMAAAVILSIVLNVWAIRTDDARQTRLFGPQPLPQQIRQTLESVDRVAGPECVASVRKTLMWAWQSRQRDELRLLIERRDQLMQLVLNKKGIRDAQENAQEDPQVDRHRRRHPDCSALDCQRRLRVA